MIGRFLILLPALGLAACNDPVPEPESAEDFAARVGTSGSEVEAAPAPQATVAVQAAPPVGADVLQLEKLGNIAGVDLGPRAGACTFSSQGNEMLIAAGPEEETLPGKATVRIGGKLFLLDAPPGGFTQVRSGTVFNGEGFSVLVTPAGGDDAKMTVTDSEGDQQVFDGKWVCA